MNASRGGPVLDRDAEIADVPLDRSRDWLRVAYSTLPSEGIVRFEGTDIAYRAWNME